MRQFHILKEDPLLHLQEASEGMRLVPALCKSFLLTDKVGSKITQNECLPLFTASSDLK
jgi:hypothetical protein